MEIQLLTLILIVLAFVILAIAVLLGGVTGWMIIKIKGLMATVEQFNAVLSRIDTATTDIANDIRELRDEVKEALENAGVPSADEDGILSRLSTVADTLEAIAKDPENPTPEPENPEQPAQ